MYYPKHSIFHRENDEKNRWISGLSRGFPPRPEAESRWAMLQRWAEKLPGFRKSWASASHVEIDELALAEDG